MKWHLTRLACLRFVLKNHTNNSNRFRSVSQVKQDFCGDWSEWSSPVKETTQPEVTSIVCLAEMIKCKPPGEVCCHQNQISFPSKD